VPPQRQRRLRVYACANGEGKGAALVPNGESPLLDLASNDYLGLSRHPGVLAAAASELAASGLGAGASRLVSGSRPIHQQLEQELAAWLGRERLLLFPSGFQANLAAVAALADRHTIVLADRLIHHSLLVGVSVSGAQLRRFPHNSLEHLARSLEEVRCRDAGRRLLVLTESIYSMEGSQAPLADLSALCNRYGAALLVDEAHALGLLGPGGRGLAHGLDGPAVVSGTLGKAFGSGGAFLAADGVVIEWLLQSSGAFRYTTALAPPLAAGALASLHWLQDQERRSQAPGLRLLERARRWRDGLEAAGWPRPAGDGPILPLRAGSDERALALQAQLEKAGLLCVAIRPPTVPPGQARLRLVVRHNLPSGTLARLLAALGPAPVTP
jgi:8-amino-7-oxononanoate synthase